MTDAQYERIAPLLPTPGGKSTVAQRQVMDALWHIAKEGCSWPGLPPEFGPWHTMYFRLNRWAKAGVQERVVAELQRDQLAGLELEALSLDSTIIKLHADGAGALRTRGARRSAARASA
ncbi:MAG: transposase [bacterium]|nr:transposase [bacterium]